MKSSPFGSTEPKRPAKCDTLDDLIQHAEHYAWFTLRDSGHIHPHVMLITHEGAPAMFPFRGGDFDEKEKDEFAMHARMIALATGASAVVLISEVWMLAVSKKQSLPEPYESPSQSPDRQEAVMLHGESRQGHQDRILPIIRVGNGKFFGLGDSILPPQTDMRGEGRFHGLLPPVVPPPDARKLGQMMLARLGYQGRPM